MKSFTISKKITSYHDTSFKKYLMEVSRIPILTASEEFKYATKARNGDKKAEELLVVCNLRFVISVAKAYVDENCKIEDLVNEGNEGLIIAAKRFDPNKGYKFITYAIWWIRHHLTLYKTNNSRTIRLPNNKITESITIKKAKLKFEAVNFREPSDSEVEEMFEGKFKTKKVREINDIINSDVRSLDYEFNTDGSTFKDVLADSNIEPTDHLLSTNDMNEKITSMLNVLSPTYQKVMIMAYGIGYERPFTLAEIGEELGKTRERIRQIKEKATLILKQHAKRKRWSVYYQD